MADPQPKLMIVEDDVGLQRQMKWAFQDSFDVHLAGDRTAALAILQEEEPPLALLDLGLPPDPNGASEGLATLAGVIEARPLTKIIVASGNEQRENAIKAISMGAYDFYSKPVDVDELKLILARAHHVHQLETENQRLLEIKKSPLEGILAASESMLSVCHSVERIASTDVTVLIHGESGTGKELIAHAVHDLSPRRGGPFVAVNCAAIPENLLESELFGHERGAFTGAVRRYIGRAEQASGGTLFLDEIGDMPLSLQSKMLRFLEGRTVQRLGGTNEVNVDVRVVSASNRDLEGMIKTGEFREDLYFRLNEVALVLPPLRDRQGDPELLARFLLQKYCASFNRPQLDFTPQAITAIEVHSWPGNVRELENRIKKAVVLANGQRITAEDLELANVINEQAPPTLKEAREQAEIAAITRAMALCDSNVTQAAKLLGVSRPTLYNLISAYNLEF